MLIMSITCNVLKKPLLNLSEKIQQLDETSRLINRNDAHVVKAVTRREKTLLQKRKENVVFKKNENVFDKK